MSKASHMTNVLEAEYDWKIPRYLCETIVQQALLLVSIEAIHREKEEKLEKIKINPVGKFIAERVTDSNANILLIAAVTSSEVINAIRKKEELSEALIESACDFTIEEITQTWNKDLREMGRPIDLKTEELKNLIKTHLQG